MVLKYLCYAQLEKMTTHQQNDGSNSNCFFDVEMINMEKRESEFQRKQ